MNTFVERSTRYTSFSSRKQPANAGIERQQFTENASVGPSVALQQPTLTHAHTKCPPVTQRGLCALKRKSLHVNIYPQCLSKRKLFLRIINSWTEDSFLKNMCCWSGLHIKVQKQTYMFHWGTVTIFWISHLHKGKILRKQQRPEQQRWHISSVGPFMFLYFYPIVCAF